MNTAKIKRDFDLNISEYDRQDIIDKPGSYRVDVRGAGANLKFEVYENSRQADFHFFGEDTSRSNDPYFYIHVRNGRVIKKFMSGRLEIFVPSYYGDLQNKC